MSEPPRTSPDESIVKNVGIGSDADAEDVSRDTYGFAESGAVTDGLTPEDARSRLERLLPDDALEGDRSRSSSPGGDPQEE